VFNLDPEQTSFLVQYVSTVAADITKTGVSRLSASMRRDRGTANSGATQRERNLAVQSILQGAGVSSATAERIGQFLIHNGSLSYLMYLAYEAQADDNAGDSSISEQANYAHAFEQELRAHLALEARIPGADLDAVTDVLSEVLRKSAGLQVRQARRTSVGRSADKVSALFLFSESNARSALFGALGEPSLAAYQDYSKRYVRTMSSAYGFVSLQHLGQESAPVELSSIYVEPTLTESPAPEVEIHRRVHDAPPQEGELTVRDAFAKSSRTVILGPAGVGKSTLVRHSVRLITDDTSEDPPIPFVLELKRYQADIGESAGLFKDHIAREITRMMQHAPPEGWIDYLLLTGRATVFFDGYDEVLNNTDRARIKDAIQSFARLYPASAVVVTTRIVGYSEIAFPAKEFLHIAINDFQPPQIKAYAENWFATRVSHTAASDSTGVKAFLAETEKYAADLRANPLMLSLLCTLFYHQGDIPRTLAELYERCATLMFQQWSVMRGLQDPGVWEQDLRPALFHIASSILNNAEYRRDGIPRDHLIQELQDFFLNESTMHIQTARERAQTLVTAWAGRAWVITEVGRDASNSAKFGFVHQSFLEYFAAVHLMRDSESSQDLFDKLRDRLVHMNGWYVAQIAVAVWHQWNRGGASSFGEALLRDAAVAGPRESLHLIMFLASLREFVSFTPTVDRLFVDAVVSLYVRSLPPLESGVNLYHLHQQTRWEDAEFEEEYLGGLDDGSGPQDLLREYAGVIGNNDRTLDAPLTTLQAERAMYALTSVAWSDSAQFDLLLDRVAATPTWDARPGATFVAVGFLMHLLLAKAAGPVEEEKGTAARRIQDKLHELYARVKQEPGYWPAHAAAYALDMTTPLVALQSIPWNSAVAREAIVLSYIRDFELPCLVTGDLVCDYLQGTPDSNLQLAALGKSFLTDLERVGGSYDRLHPIPAYDSRSMIQIWVNSDVPTPIRLDPDRRRNGLHLAGLFVIFGAAWELDRQLKPGSFLAASNRSPEGCLLRLMDRSAPIASSDVAALRSQLKPDHLVAAVLSWRQAEWSLTNVGSPDAYRP
jgi:hypothetical protein